MSIPDGADASNGTAAISEDELHSREVALRLTLRGGPRWSGEVARGQLGGLRMSLDAGVSLRLLRVALASPTSLLLYIERHPTLDVDVDMPLTLRVVHTCEGSALSGDALPPCHAGDVAAAPAASTLTAVLLVRSCGTPPGRPGAPWLRHMSSYEQVQLLWEAAEAPTTAPVRSAARHVRQRPHRASGRLRTAHCNVLRAGRWRPTSRG